MSTDAPQDLLLLGTRLFAIEMADVISEIPGYRVAGFVENMDRSRCDQRIEGLPIYWVDDVAPLAKTHLALAALSTTHRGRFTEQVAAQGMRFATVVHPSAIVSAKTTLGEGTFVNRGAIIAGYSALGRHVIINRGVIIGHHTQLGDFTTVQPGANVSGACHIASRVYIGVGASIIDQLTIGEQTVIGAGATVIEDLPARVLAVGVPAKVVRQNIEGK